MDLLPFETPLVPEEMKQYRLTSAALKELRQAILY
jgi:hypothetical protein